MNFYRTKFVSDTWMEERDFLEKDHKAASEWWWKLKVSALNLSAPITVVPSTSVQDAIEIMNAEGFDQLPIVDEQG